MYCFSYKLILAYFIVILKKSDERHVFSDKRQKVVKNPALKLNSLPCSDANRLVVCFDPYVKAGRILHDIAVGRESEVSESIQIINYLNIGGVPNIIITAYSTAKLFHLFPMLLRAELVAVAPNIQKTHKIEEHGRLEAFPKLLCKGSVMTSGVPAHEIRRDSEGICIRYCS